MGEVWLITSGAALESLRVTRAGQVLSPIWLSAGVLTDAEIEALRLAGADVSVFADAIDVSDEGDLADAIDTIELHHPGHVVRVA